MHMEFDDLKKRPTWILKKNSYFPRSAKILSCTWYFKINIAPNGSLINRKALLCVRWYVHNITSMETMDTYSPVVCWSTL